MQLGKLGVCQEAQDVSCKTRRNRAEHNQRVTAKKQNQEFEPLEHSVYCGRKRLGSYKCISKTRYAAYDARDRELGRFQARREAWAAVSRAAPGGSV
jgi:hypothetical protein